jgi:hypothetical protein
MARRFRYRAIINPRRWPPILFALLLGSLAGAADAATLALVPAQSHLGQGRHLSVKVRISGADDLFSAPFYVRYDPRHLRVIAVKQGDFLKRGGVSTAFLHKEKRHGTVMVGLSRLGNKPGVSGSGTLATLTFITLGAGHTTISLSKHDLKDSQLAPAKVKVENATISIGTAKADSAD